MVFIVRSLLYLFRLHSFFSNFFFKRFHFIWGNILKPFKNRVPPFLFFFFNVNNRSMIINITCWTGNLSRQLIFQIRSWFLARAFGYSYKRRPFYKYLSIIIWELSSLLRTGGRAYREIFGPPLELDRRMQIDPHADF